MCDPQENSSWLLECTEEIVYTRKEHMYNLQLVSGTEIFYVGYKL